MQLLKRSSMALLAAAVGVLLTAGAWAQTAANPIRSRMQILANNNVGESFLVDPGVTKVSVDVRQLSPYDSCSMTGPSSQPVSYTKAVSYPVVSYDLDGEGDPLGHYQTVMTWNAPDVGWHTIWSQQEYVALVHFEGGAEMSFWFEGLRADNSAYPWQPFTLWASMINGWGQPVTGAYVMADIEWVAQDNGLPASWSWKQTVTFKAGTTPGTYYARLNSGLQTPGVYHISAYCEHFQYRRQAAASIYVSNALTPPARAPGAPSPPIIKTFATGEKVAAFPGQVFVGPEDRADRTKPVIVFLHGWNGDTEIWDRPNGGFYHAALDANYRVASVGLHPDRDFMTNANILNQAIPSIAAHYDVKKVVVVAHSKGGVDVDAYLMLMNGADYITSVMTLSTPHHGTALADVIDSLPDWLAGDWENEGQESMRPGNMAMFRALVVNNPNQSRVDIRTFGAWGYDEVNSSSTLIEFAYRDITGPLLKALAGDNDGIVPYASSVRPVALQIFGGKPDSRTEYNHARIRKRVDYWHHIQAQLLTCSWDNTPSPPFNVVAQLSTIDPNTGNVTLTWENRSRFANTLRVERSVDGGAFGEIAVLPVAVPVYVDLGVTSGHTYAYRLRYGINSQWTSGYSNTASVVFQSAVPNAPTNLVALPGSPTSIQLTWTDNSTNETGFQVERRPNVTGSSFALIATVGTNIRQFTNTSLTPNTSYVYRVRAINGTFASGYSNTATALTPPLPLNAPSSLAGVYNATTNRVNLTWADNSANEDGFALQMAYAGGAWSDLFPPTVGPNVVSYQTGTFPVYGIYQFRVRAFRGAEVSGWSNVATVDVVPPPQPLVAPSNLAGVYNPATNRVTLTWTDNSTGEDGFSLQMSYAGGAWSDLNPPTVGPNVTSFLTGTFPVFGYFDFRVRTFRGSEVTAWSNVARVGVFP